MKHLQIITTLLLFLALAACQDQQTKKESSETKGLQETLSVFNNAFKEGNLNILDSLTTENYIHSNGSSKAFDKASWFAYLEKRTAQLESGALEVLAYELNDTVIKRHYNTAIVTGRIKVVTKDSLETKESQFRVTNIWVKESGIWKRAGFHDGKIE